MKNRININELCGIIRQSKKTRRSILSILGAGALSLSFSSSGFAKQSERKPLKFLNWDTYIGEATLEDFTENSQIPISMELFSSNEELIGKIRNGESYDVIVPSNDYVKLMIDEDLLSPLNQALIPNAKNIGIKYQNNNYDVGLKFSMPYTWFVEGIGYLKSAFENGEIPTSWKYVFENPQMAKDIMYYDNNLDIYCLAALYLGLDIKTYSDEKLSKVIALLSKQAANSWRSHEDYGQGELLKKNAKLVIEYNGDIALAAIQDNDIGFVVPSEGSLLYCDSLCIPKSSQSPDEAHEFINFVLDGVNGAKIAKYISYPTPNNAAFTKMPSSYRNNKIIFQDDETMKRCQYVPNYSKDDIAKINEAFEILQSNAQTELY